MSRSFSASRSLSFRPWRASIEHVDAAEVRPAAEDSRRRAASTSATCALRRARIAVAGHVDDGDAGIGAEEVQLLRPARRVRGAGERLLPDERVDQRRLADIGAAGERDLDTGGRRQRPSTVGARRRGSATAARRSRRPASSVLARVRAMRRRSCPLIERPAARVGFARFAASSASRCSVFALGAASSRAAACRLSSLAGAGVVSAGRRSPASPSTGFVVA